MHRQFRRTPGRCHRGLGRPLAGGNPVRLPERRGFNFEDIHLTDPQRLSKLMGLLALAFAWTDRTGERLHDGPSPIRPKKPWAGPSSRCSATDSTASAASP